MRHPSMFRFVLRQVPAPEWTPLQALSIHCAGLSHLKQWTAGVIGVDRRSVEGILRALPAPYPDLTDPMAGGSAPSLSMALANAGDLGAAARFRSRLKRPWAEPPPGGQRANARSRRNLWVPDQPPNRSDAHETRRGRLWLAE